MLLCLMRKKSRSGVVIMTWDARCCKSTVVSSDMMREWSDTRHGQVQKAKAPTSPEAPPEAPLKKGPQKETPQHIRIHPSEFQHHFQNNFSSFPFTFKNSSSLIMCLYLTMMQLEESLASCVVVGNEWLCKYSVLSKKKRGKREEKREESKKKISKSSKKVK